MSAEFRRFARPYSGLTRTEAEKVWVGGAVYGDAQILAQLRDIQDRQEAMDWAEGDDGFYSRVVHACLEYQVWRKAIGELSGPNNLKDIGGYLKELGLMEIAGKATIQACLKQYRDWKETR